MLRDIHPALVAWAISAASLPILATGTLLLMQCAIIWRPAGVLVTCVANLPWVDFVFGLALLGSAVLNRAATLISTHALAAADASLVSTLLTFHPAFTLLVAWPTLGEAPGLRQTLGMALVLLGAYLLEVEGARAGILEPLRILLHSWRSLPVRSGELRPSWRNWPSSM